MECRKPKKAWYDQSACIRTLNKGDTVLVLFPTSSNMLVAQWQGPYKVCDQAGGNSELFDQHAQSSEEGKTVSHKYVV